MRNIIYIFFFLSLFCSAQTNQTVKTDNLEYYIQNKKIGLRDRTTKQMIVACKYDYIGGFNKSGLSVVKNNELWGFINSKSVECIKLQYQEAKSFSTDYKLAAVKKGEKWGFINTQGLVKINFLYDDVYGIYEGIASVKRNGKWGGVNTLGKEIIPFDYDEKFYFTKEGYAVVKKDGKWGTINKNAKNILPIIYDSRLYFNSDGLAESKKDNKYGVVKMDGTEILPCQYKEVDYILDGMIAVKESEKWGFVDYTGKIIIDYRFSNVRGFENNIAYVSDEHGSYLISKDTRTLQSFSNASLIFPVSKTEGDKFYVTYKSGKHGLVNESGKTIIPIKYDDIKTFLGAGLIAVQNNDKWGFFDLQGNLKISYLYNEVSYNFENGVIAAKKNNLWGVIDTSGITVVPFEYDDMKQRSTYFEVKKGDFYGALDEKGKMVLDCKYDLVDWYMSSLRYFPVKLNGKVGYADIYGNDTF